MTKHCPFCGGTRVSIIEGETFRWRHAECAECQATSGNVRIQTTGDGTDEQWEAAAKVEAMERWDERHETKAEAASDRDWHLVNSSMCVGRIEGLQYVAEWIHYHRTIPNQRPGYLAALGDMQTHVDAAIERLRHGEPMRMSSQLDTTEELDNERERR